MMHKTSIFMFLTLVIIVASYDYFVLLHEVTETQRNLVIIYRMLAASMVAVGLSMRFMRHALGRWVIVMLAFLDAILTITYVLYNRYFGGLLSPYDLTNADEGAAVLDYILIDLLHISDLAVLIAPVALLMLVVLNKKSHWTYIFRHQFPVKISPALLALLFGVAMYTAPYVFYKDLHSWRTQGAATFIHVGGLLGFLTYDAVDLVSRNDTDSIELIYPEIQGEQYTETVIQRFPGANVIFLQVESLDSAVLDKLYNGVPITPFINKLSKQSVTLNRHIAIHTKGSVDADASSITGSFTVPYGSLYGTVDLKKYPSIVKDLNIANYTTAMFHSNRGSFYDRNKAVRNMGFDKWYFQPFYSDAFDFGKSWGVNDEDFLLVTADEINRLPIPFFAHVITITSHAPFEFDIKDKAIPQFESIEDPLLRGYYNSINFVDQAVELFFNKMEKYGLLKNTIFVIYGDHDAHLHVVNKDGELAYSSMNYLQAPTLETMSYPSHVPVIIVTPEKIKKSINKPTLHVDLVPTTLDLLGIKTPRKTYLSQSAFSSTATPMIIDNNKKPYLIYDGCIYRKTQGEYRLVNSTKWAENRSCTPPSAPRVSDADKIILYSRNMWRKYRR